MKCNQFNLNYHEKILPRTVSNLQSFSYSSFISAGKCHNILYLDSRIIPLLLSVKSLFGSCCLFMNNKKKKIAEIFNRNNNNQRAAQWQWAITKINGDGRLHNQANMHRTKAKENLLIVLEEVLN